MANDDSSSHKGLKELRLPISRVKTIMKSSPQVENISQDCLFLVAKATELFVHYFAEDAYKHANRSSILEYKHLAEIVQTTETLEFLREIMPRKITVKQFKEMMAAKESNSSSDSDSDSQSDSESDSDSEDVKMENGNSSSSEESENKHKTSNSLTDSSSSSSSDEDNENNDPNNEDSSVVSDSGSDNVKVNS